MAISAGVTASRNPEFGFKEEQPYVDPTPKRHTGYKLLVVLAVWVVGWLIFRGQNTLAIPFNQLNWFSTWINHVRDDVQAALPTNWFFHGVIGHISSFVNWLVNQIGNLISHPAEPRPVPEIGWLGVLAIFTWIGFAVAGLRSAILVAVSFLLFGIFGYWTDSVDTLIVTAIAVVASLLAGIPLGIAMARRQTVSSIVTPVLDVMQTMPSFSYLLPAFMIFGPGATCGIVLTMVYCLPPLVRITELGLKSVPATTQEAAQSLGVTRGQLLRQVQLPMARRTIVLGVNQCTLAALSMTVIAALVAAPGLGTDVYAGLQIENVGQAAVPGLLIVVIAIMLDRTTTAASERSQRQGRGRSLGGRNRRLVLLGGLAVVAVTIYLSRTYLDLATFPTSWNLGGHLQNGINSLTDNIVSAIDTYTAAFKNFLSYGFLNPLQNLLANSPWWLMAPVLLGFAFVLGGLRPMLIAAAGEGVILATGLWNDTMQTFTSTLVATVLVMVIAVVVGVWIGRSRRADAVLRPILDGFQTIPSFVYLVPALALFTPSRFTAIAAAVAYAAPISVKLVADGIRGVSPTTVEAARSSGITSWQMIRKVQLPMARPALVLATNQGLLYVLSMVVIGGLVGGGSLGYIIVTGFSQPPVFGKGFAAGIAVTALGIMLDRIARASADRYGK
ncbi:MAG TPA: ABC transporter permease subunit [Nocardioides sp.]|uniref:ABC transporter permease n=1 Tax=Nocardioides sp. TaxID=35761 RepID=UPI002E3327E1|nr:ABC transporter permease subunit [Nocardioides sp.]HEX3929794.1 ABC transporter permease subunit [Nocardioides sp.]